MAAPNQIIIDLFKLLEKTKYFNENCNLEDFLIQANNNDFLCSIFHWILSYVEVQYHHKSMYSFVSAIGICNLKSIDKFTPIDSNMNEDQKMESLTFWFRLLEIASMQKTDLEEASHHDDTMGLHAEQYLSIHGTEEEPHRLSDDLQQQDEEEPASPRRLADEISAHAETTQQALAIVADLSHSENIFLGEVQDYLFSCQLDLSERMTQLMMYKESISMKTARIQRLIDEGRLPPEDIERWKQVAMTITNQFFAMAEALMSPRRLVDEIIDHADTIRQALATVADLSYSENVLFCQVPDDVVVARWELIDHANRLMLDLESAIMEIASIHQLIDEGHLTPEDIERLQQVVWMITHEIIEAEKALYRP